MIHAQLTIIVMCFEKIDDSIQKSAGLIDIEKGVPLNRLEILVNLILHFDDICQAVDSPSIELQPMRPRITIQL